MRHLHRFPAYLLLAALVACASVPSPKTIGESLVYAQSTATAANTAALSLLKTRVITVSQAVEVSRDSSLVVDTVRHARTLLGAGDAAGAQAQLAAVSGELKLLQSFLDDHK